MTYTPQKVDALPGAAYSTYTDMRNVNDSTGLVSGASISDNLDGTVDITACEFFCRNANDPLGTLISASLGAQSSVALTDTSLNFIYASYNGGTPNLSVSPTPLADFHQNVVVGVIYRDGTTLHITEIGIPTTQTDQQISRRLVFLDGVRRQNGGAAVTEPASLKIAISTGNFWLGLIEYTLTAIDTNVSDTFGYWYDGASGWTEIPAQTDIDNLQYNNPGVGFATLTNNRYGVHWVIKGVDGDTYVIYGRQDNNTLADAELEAFPPDLPPHMNIFHAVAIAKVIVLKSAASFTEIRSL